MFNKTIILFNKSSKLFLDNRKFWPRTTIISPPPGGGLVSSAGTRRTSICSGLFFLVSAHATSPYAHFSATDVIIAIDRRCNLCDVFFKREEAVETPKTISHGTIYVIKVWLVFSLRIGAKWSSQARGVFVIPILIVRLSNTSYLNQSFEFKYFFYFLNTLVYGTVWGSGALRMLKTLVVAVALLAAAYFRGWFWTWIGTHLPIVKF